MDFSYWLLGRSKVYFSKVVSLTSCSVTPKIESIFFTATDKFTYVSSSMVKEIALYKGKVGEFVDPVVQKELEKKFN